jgi:hypothetical protein
MSGLAARFSSALRKAMPMRHKRRVADERQEFVGHVTKQRLVGQELGSKPVHRDSVRRYVALRT